MTKRFDPKLDTEVREFSRSLLKKTSQAAGVIQDEKIRSVEGVGTYGNYSGKSPHNDYTSKPCFLYETNVGNMLCDEVLTLKQTPTSRQPRSTVAMPRN